MFGDRRSDSAAASTTATATAPRLDAALGLHPLDGVRVVQSRLDCLPDSGVHQGLLDVVGMLGVNVISEFGVSRRCVRQGQHVRRQQRDR